MPTPSPAVAHHRARIGALRRGIRAGERRPDDPALTDAYQNMRAELLVEHVAKVLADWPPLSPEQLDRVAALLRTVNTSSGVMR
jgi:hypothetical protein